MILKHLNVKSMYFKNGHLHALIDQNLSGGDQERYLSKLKLKVFLTVFPCYT